MNFKHSQHYQAPKAFAASGFTLIEILISMLIISIGLLSFALLQAESLRATHTSMQRTKAISFATDMFERMRANTASISVYTVDNSAPAASPAKNCSEAYGAITTCTSAEMAQFDIWEWKTALANERAGIIGGLGEIAVGGTTTPYPASITITWNDRATNSSYTLNTVILK